VASLNGKLGDYAECPAHVFADARTSFNLPYARPPLDIEPKLKEFKALGGNRFALTYEWIVNDKLAENYNSFVHFTNETAADGFSHIVFQADHKLPKPTSEWQPGDRIVDGPHEITVPDGDFTRFDIVIGLWVPTHRARLKGPDADDRRILLGELRVTRDGQHATDVQLVDTSARAAAMQADRLDFTAGLNPAGTRLDFGKIATDGSVKVNRAKNRLVVFPYPREREFTVTLNLPALLPSVKGDWSKAKVQALAAATQADMGRVAAQIAGGKLTWKCGGKGVGRYVVTW
jgi:hypothetical protein